MIFLLKKKVDGVKGRKGVYDKKRKEIKVTP